MQRKLKHVSADLEVYNALKEAHELSLSRPFLHHHEYSASKIAEAANKDFFISEILHMLAPQFASFKTSIPDVYAESFMKPDAIEDIYKIKEDSRGRKCIYIRDLAVIESNNGQVYFNRQNARWNSLLDLEDRIRNGFDERGSIFNENIRNSSPASKLAHSLCTVASPFSAYEFSRENVEKFAPSLAKKTLLYRNPALLAIGAEVMSCEEYCLIAGLTPEESQKFKKLIKEIFG